MNITVEKLPKSQVKIKVELTAEEVEKHREEAVAALSKDVQLPGFRPGHVPLEVAESRLGPDLIFSKTLEKAIPISYAEAVVKEKLTVVARPEIKIISEKPLSYEATVAILPEVTFKKDLSSIKLPKTDTALTEKEVEESLKNLRMMLAETPEIKEPAQKGHKVEVTFDGFDAEGKALPGTSSKNHPFIIGEGVFYPEFENHMVGLKSGDTKEFDVTFPADYSQKQFASKKIHFKANMGRVMDVKLPEINEEFVEKMTGKKQSVGDFTADFKKSLQRGKESDAKQKKENDWLDELIKIAEIDLPEALIEEEIDFLIEQTKINLKQKGIPWVEYEKYLTEKKIDLRSKYKPEAVKYVSLRLILNHLFEKNAITLSDDDLNERIKEIVASYPEEEKQKVQKHYDEDGQARNQLKNRMKMDRLFEVYLGK